MLPLYRRSTVVRVIPTFYPMVMLREPWALCPASRGDSDIPSLPCGEEGRGDAKEVKILSRGLGPKGLVQPGWRGEFSTW